MKRDEKGRAVISFSPDLAGSVLFIALSLFFLLTMDDEVYVGSSAGVNARTLPFIVLCTILVLSLYMLVKEIVLMAMGKERRKVFIVLSEELRTLLIFLLMLSYAFLIPLMGFAISSVLFSLLYAFLLGCRKGRYFIIIALLSLLISFLFIHLLNARF
ncbi:MAG TPA: tripartite tricarboxylate transporter TctB family protein [Candidatus Ornithospirochaeta stercorigallinarum]|nr:tripartite tricarboxylate transporter TctB family protein [Candidatus Ornithospirochaeta stercorigallinarum]